jgi:ADP-heptose:LPS heptosyltransferase
MVEQPRQILVIQTAFIGDAILATAVLEKLHAHFPEAAIDFLVRKGNESLFVGHPFLRRVLVRDKILGKLKSLRLVLREVRSAKYDIVANLHRFASSGIIAGFSGAKHICGFDKNPFSWRYDHKVPHVIGTAPDSPHEIERNQSVIAHLTDARSAPPRLYPSPADFAAVQIMTPYICVAPTSVWFTKQWPAAKWSELIAGVDARYTVCLLGAPSDRGACEAIARASGHPHVRILSGELTLLQSATLMKGAAMNYVNDSAPMHLASAMDAPVTAIYCSTVPAFGFGPRSSRSFVLETTEKLDCRPCGLHGFKACPMGHFKCAEIAIPSMVKLKLENDREGEQGRP